MMQHRDPTPLGGAAPPAKPLCVKCHMQEAALDSRSQLVCRDCFSKFISAKCVKQVGIISKDIRNPGTGAESQKKKYVLGLSLGVSSSVLVHLLNENVEYQLTKGRSAPFDLIIVHVDSSSLFSPDGTNSAETTLAKYRKRYPRFEFRRVPIADVLNLHTVDWSTMLPLISPAKAKDTPQPGNEQQLREIFDHLPSSTSRTDIIRLFTRHLLISATRDKECHALLLGHTTTALAELTLSETAKGRGFSLPWQVNDGSVAVVDYDSSTNTPTITQIQIYHPLRELLRKELVIYATDLTTPPLVTDLAIFIPNHPSSSSSSQPPSVINHKDLSIEQVMFRYFTEVEDNYPSVVANVARTTGKLVRILGGPAMGENGEGDHDHDHDHEGDGHEELDDRRERCGLCSMPLDEQGDERWRGELGDNEVKEEGKGRICYGCERSIRG